MEKLFNIFPADAAEIMLPAPTTTGGMPLMEAISARKSTREFNPKKQLDPQQISDLLWAACGFNREEMRTIPTALNRQDISVYAITPLGSYRYDAEANKLVKVTSKNICRLAGMQDFAQEASLNIAIVSDFKKMEMDIYARVGAGAAMENIYLWCASNSVGTVGRASFDNEALSEALKLDESQRVLIVQTVGY